jgi:T4 RnlA family RNA ligase
MELERMEQLQALVRTGFADWRTLGNVKAVYHDGLVLFNYTAEAQYERRWNWFERVSRGLILDATTGEVVARPFDKFFNWGERGQTTDAPIVSITEKLDGSLGIAYWRNGQWNVATRGSFESEQAKWATRWLREWLGDIPCPLGTYLFEIIYPKNRVVVDYRERAELVLLAVRDPETGAYWHQSQIVQLAEDYGFTTAWRWPLATVDDIIAICAKLDANHEGFVAEFADGQRFKFKGDAYKELHRLICGLSFKNTVEAIASDKVGEVRDAIPDEFLTQFNEWVQEINAKYQAVTERVEAGYALAPKGTRKDFALWVQTHGNDLAPYLFAKMDGRDYAPLIYKREF